MISQRSRRPIIGLLAGSGISLLGNLMTLVALPWFVLQATGSAARTGVASAVWLLPVVLAGMLGGPIVDRLGHRRSIIIGDIVGGTAIGLVPVLHHTIGLAFWQLLLLVFIRGLFDIPGRTARRAILPELAQQAGVPLERANSWFIVIRDIGSLMGPALSGVLIVVAGPENVLLIDAATYFISALLVAKGIPTTQRALDEQASPNYLSDLVDGLRFLRGHQLIFILLLTSTLISFLSEPLYGVVLPVFTDSEHGSAFNLGVILAGFGAGSLGGTFLFGVFGNRVPRRPVMVGAALAMGLPFLVLATLPPFLITLMVVALVGFVSAPFTILYATVLQEQIPTNMRGRVFGLETTIGVLGMPLGVLAVGFLIEGIGLRTTLIIQGGAFVLIALFILLHPALKALSHRP